MSDRFSLRGSGAGVRGARLPLEILAQPDDVTCGPTCLHAVYRYFGLGLPIERVIDEVEQLETRGTLAVMLARHALEHGFRATIHTLNLTVFDPTWFRDGVDLVDKLRRQARIKDDPRIRFATRGYLDVLSRGGEVHFAELGPELLLEPLRRGLPVLTGLSATYLYGCAREIERDGAMVYDDVEGVPVGHFVVLHGHEPRDGTIWVADPLHENPGFGTHVYAVPAQRVLAAILLGALTYDANLLILEPAARGETGGVAHPEGKEPAEGEPPGGAQEPG